MTATPARMGIIGPECDIAWVNRKRHPDSACGQTRAVARSVAGWRPMHPQFIMLRCRGFLLLDLE